jgi:chromosome segregation ATPase
VTPRPALRAAALAALAVVLLAAAPAPARAANAADPDGDAAARRAEVAALNREVTEITRRIAQVDAKAAEMADYESTLAKQVDALKRAAPGVMRDAQLKDALKELRRVLAGQRNLENVAGILNTTLRTRQVALAGKADAEADRLLAQGEAAVRAGRDARAAAHFESALDLLMLGNAARPKSDAARPRAVPEPTGRFSLTGHETPDEMRELGLILRDGADKLRWNALVLSGELERLQVEQRNLKALLALAPAPSQTGTRSLDELSRRIAWVSGEIQRLRNSQTSFLARAALVEREAGREEQGMLDELEERHASAEPAP